MHGEDQHLTELLEDDVPIALIDIVDCEVLARVSDLTIYRPR